MNDFKQQLAPGWTAVNIGITVVLYLLIGWPLAILMVAYIMWGEKADLDLRRPTTFSVFARRISTAFRAGIDSFNNRS